VNRGAPAGSRTDQHVVLASSAVRRRLLDLLCDRTTLHDAHELAQVLGLHVTTIRFHLDILRRAGLVEAHSQPRAGAGRPRTVYTATPDGQAPQAPSGYEMMTGLLAAHLDDDPTARSVRAERAGLAWAATFPAPPPPARESSDLAAGSDRAAQRVTTLFAELGFDPELTIQATQAQVRLRACPFLKAALAHPEVICSVHRGLLRGTLTRLGAPVAAARLDPFVEPHVCLISLPTALPATGAAEEPT
jgi:predicted ArsR family transcriptional regulator